MPPNEHSASAHHYATPDKLRIGMHVHLDLPWFMHPFARNSFRIATDEQIAQLRALDLPHIRYDPEHSDTAPGKDVSAEAADPAPPAAEAPAPDIAPAGPAAAAVQERMLRLREHRRMVAQTEKAFIKATGIMRKINKNVLLRPQECLDEMHGLVDQMAMVFLGDSDASLRVMGEKCGGEEAYFHGLNVSVLSAMLARGLDFSEEQARALAAGALLHDIGQIEIPDRVLKKDPGEFTRPERELYASHVEIGLRIGRQLGLAPEVMTIIAQHHEMADGSGYPRAIMLEQLAPPARVVALVNLYDNLCNPVIPNQAMTPHEALSFIFARRRGKFDQHVLQLLIRSLGVYPPGSIVKLSSGAIALVISVNARTALRPWVMLHDADVPEDQAGLLDLEQDAGVSISHCLRPALLPPAVYAYLSPRKRITYFFDSEPPGTAQSA